MYRKYTFVIDFLYKENGVVLQQTETKRFVVNAHDDLEAFKSLCKQGWYQSIDYDQHPHLMMYSEKV